MNRPKASTTPPANRYPVVDFSHRLTALAVNAPTTVNTREKPRMNSRMGTRFIRFPGSGRSPPVTKDRYPGTRGRTHGDTNDTTPAAKARAGPHQAATLCSTPPTMGTYLLKPAPPEHGLQTLSGRAKLSLMLVNGFTSGLRPPPRGVRTHPVATCLSRLGGRRYNPPALLRERRHP